MKTFIDQAAQGDLLITRVGALPRGATAVAARDGRHVLAHSETGHDHAIADRPGVEYFVTGDPLVAYLRVADEVEALLEHERFFDAHESLLIGGGVYEIRRQRERAPQGWRRTED